MYNDTYNDTCVARRIVTNAVQSGAPRSTGQVPQNSFQVIGVLLGRGRKGDGAPEIPVS